MLKIVMRNWLTIRTVGGIITGALIIILVPFVGTLLGAGWYAGYVAKLAFNDFNKVIVHSTSEEEIHGTTRSALTIVAILGLLAISAPCYSMFIFDLVDNLEARATAIASWVIILVMAVACSVAILNRAVSAQLARPEPVRASDRQPHPPTRR